MISQGFNHGDLQHFLPSIFIKFDSSVSDEDYQKIQNLLQRVLLKLFDFLFFLSAIWLPLEASPTIFRDDQVHTGAN